jgi:hypothetical protein
MNKELLILGYVGLFISVFAAFGMQRATLVMSRQSGLPYQMTSMLLPAWFPLVWIPRIAKWSVLVAIAFSWSWILAVVVLFVDIVLSSVLPIPYQMYMSSFRKRIQHIRQDQPALPEALEELVDASKYPKSA